MTMKTPRGQIEYYTRKLPGENIYSLCKAPFAGLEISPDGQIVLCCMSSRNHLAHIDDVDDIEEFYNGPIMEKYRQELEDGEYKTMKPCNRCYELETKHKRGFKKTMEGYQTQKLGFSVNSMGNITKFDEDWYARKEGKNRPLRYLEYTLSNTCNASCATCNSLFSHKWQSIDKKFGRKVFPMVQLKNNSIEKIEKVLYGLETLTIKGGEPFADIRNIRILKKLYEINPSCRVFIVSNFYTITPEAMEILKMTTGHLDVSGSVDGVGRVYDWIRSNTFEHMVKTMETYYKETGRKININVCISLYNFFHLEKILDYFKNKEYIRCISFMNITNRPGYVDIQLLPEKIFYLQIEKYKKLFKDVNKKGYSAWILSDPLLRQKWHPKFYEKTKDDSSQGNDKVNKELFFTEMEKMNEHRGFDLCDHIPELKIWRDSP